MGETIVRLYEDRDAEGVAALFARNNFFFPRGVSGDEYRRISALRGLICAVVAEKDGEIVAHMNAVRNGRMMSFRPHQAYTGNLLIDRGFRTHMYSLTDMQRLLIRTLNNEHPEILDLVSTVVVGNLPSMFIQRQTGAALIQWAPDLDGYVQFHNFAMSMPLLFQVMTTEKGMPLSAARSLLPFKKSEYNRENERLGERLVRSDFEMYSEHLALWNNIYSGYVCRFDLPGRGLTAALEDGQALRLTNGGEAEAAWRVTARCGGEKRFEEACPLPVGAEKVFPLSPDTDLVRLDLLGTDLTFCLFPQKDWLEDKYLDRREGCPLGDGALVNAQTGSLHIGGLQQEDQVLSFTWPEFELPYNQGPLYPNTWLGLETQRRGEGVTMRQRLHGFQVTRDYTPVTGGWNVRMRLKREDMDAPKERIPLVGFFLEDAGGTLSLMSGDREILNCGLDNQRDHDRCGSRSLYFIDFMNEPYTKEIVTAATFRTRRGNYQITADRPFTALYQYGYLSLRYLTAAEAAGGVDIDAPEIDFGNVTIVKV